MRRPDISVSTETVGQQKRDQNVKSVSIPRLQPWGREYQRYSYCLHFAGSSASDEVVRSYSQVTFTLHMRRNPRYYVVNLIIPCCLLSFIAVVTFILPPSCFEKLSLSTYIQ